MELIQIRYEHSAFQLFRGYLKGVRKALSVGDVEQFMLYRKGYEVLRNEESFEAYHRIYRKYILNQKLNYPPAKEKQLIAQYQEKEQKAEEFVRAYNNSLPSFGSHLTWLLTKFAAFDLVQIIGFGGSGILFTGVGVWAMMYFGNFTNIIGGSLAVLIGFFFAWRNLVDFVKS